MASIKVSMHIDGLKELEVALLELPKATQGNVLKRAATAAAADFADYASALAPKGPTGKLKREIKVGKAAIISPGKAAFAAAMNDGATRAEAAAAARTANREAGGSGKSVVVSAGPTKRAFYGQFSEFGTRYMAAKPFMRPAWDALQRPMVDTMADTLREEIEKARARLARKAERTAGR